jgi:anti-sigma factor RsiW
MTLSEEELALIHAALDGELTAEQHQRLADLLTQSPAARKYYSLWRKFQKRLRAVDPPPPPQELHAWFQEFVRSQSAPNGLPGVAARQESQLEPTARPTFTDGTPVASPHGSPLPTPSQYGSFSADAPTGPAPSTMVFSEAAPEGPVTRRYRERRRPWVAELLLASIAFTGLVALAWLVANFHGQADPEVSSAGNTTTVEKTAEPRHHGNDRFPPPSRSGIAERDAAPQKSPAGQDSPDRLPVAPSPETALALAPPPREAPLDLFTAPLLPPIRIDMAEIRLPFLRMLGEFEREDVQLAFVQQLQRESAVRIDLFTRDLGRGVQWLQKAAQQAGLHLVVDATTADRLRKGAPITAVVLYCDNLTPAELTRFVILLNQEDAKISPRLFDVVHMMPLAPADERDLREVLGADPGLHGKVRPDKSERSIGEAPQRPLSAGTAEDIRSLTAKKSLEKSGLVTAWAPSAARTPPFLSAEIKSYLARKAPRSPQAVPAVIILRLPNSP